MSDTAYENAVKRRDEIIAHVKGLETRVASLRSEWERVEAFIDQWHDFAGTPLLDRSPTLVLRPAVANAIGTSVVASVGRAVRNSKKEEVAEAARDIILERNRVMGRTELYEALTSERGLTIQGSDPGMVLSTMLWRMRNLVVRVRGGGYWVADRDSPDDAYKAGDLMDQEFISAAPREEVEHAMGGDLGDGE